MAIPAPGIARKIPEDSQGEIEAKQAVRCLVELEVMIEIYFPERWHISDCHQWLVNHDIRAKIMGCDDGGCGIGCVEVRMSEL